MAYVNENEEEITLNQDTEEVDTINQDTEEVDTESDTENDTESDTENAEARKALARKALARKNAEAKKLKQEHQFLYTKNFYEKYIILIKLMFNNYFSILERKGKIRECDAEEFSKSENTEEFQSMKMRVQKEIREDIFTNSDGDIYDFTLKIFSTYGWKAMGLFN